jgi:hypothetical protein
MHSEILESFALAHCVNDRFVDLGSQTRPYIRSMSSGLNFGALASAIVLQFSIILALALEWTPHSGDSL